MQSRRSRRGSVHGRIAALEAKFEARHVQPILIEYTAGRVCGVGDAEWPSLEAALAALEGKQSRPPLVIRLAVDPAVVAPDAPKEAK